MTMNNGQWTVQKSGALEYLTAANLAAVHGFTTRFGGVSEGIFSSLNLGANRGDSLESVKENHRRLAAALGYSPEKLILANQVHGDLVRVVTENDCIGSISHLDYPVCDALVTATPGVAIMSSNLWLRLLMC